MIKSPCKDCPNRKVGCHSDCAHYIQFKQTNDELNRKRIEQESTDKYFVESIVHNKSEYVRKHIQDGRQNRWHTLKK